MNRFYKIEVQGEDGKPENVIVNSSHVATIRMSNENGGVTVTMANGERLKMTAEAYHTRSVVCAME